MTFLSLFYDQLHYKCSSVATESEFSQAGRLDNAISNIKIVESYANQTGVSEMEQTKMHKSEFAFSLFELSTY